MCIYEMMANDFICFAMRDGFYDGHEKKDRQIMTKLKMH